MATGPFQRLLIPPIIPETPGLAQIPYATLHAGRMTGGVELDVVPEDAVIDFEIRHLFSEPVDAFLAEVVANLPKGIEIAQVNVCPGLNADPANAAIARLARHLDDPGLIKVSYGTEAGCFAGLVRRSGSQARKVFPFSSQDR